MAEKHVRLSIDAPSLRIGVRLRDWSPWARQIVNGVRRFAHEREQWKLYIDVANSHRAQDATAGIKLDGMLSALLGFPTGWKRLLAEGHTKIVGFTVSVAPSLSAIPIVRMNEFKVAELVVSHLRTAGFRRIAYCAGGDPLKRLDVRLQAIRDATKAVECPLDIYRQNRPDINRRLLHCWIRELPKPIGVVAFNTVIARDVIDACNTTGIPVPDQVGVVSWDDDPMLAETIEPTISAAVLPAERLGYEAARLLDQILRGKGHVPKLTLVEPVKKLIVRESSDVSSVKDREVYLAQQFITEHAAESIKVPHVAKAMGISRKKLEMDFQRVTGVTPGQAIARVRIELAKKLLAATSLTTHEVAARSGLGSEPTLRRLLLRHEKLTPGQYRLRFARANQKQE